MVTDEDSRIRWDLNKLSPTFYSLLLVVTLVVLRNYMYQRQRKRGRIIAFFHPFCNGGGGGERVLWLTIRSIIDKIDSNDIKIVIYSGDRHIPLDKSVALANERFRLGIPQDRCSNLGFQYIYSRTLLDAKWYPVATMIFQSLGSLFVGFECALHVVPDVFIDTTGASFLYPILWLFGCRRIIAYIHYPTISPDMLTLVRERRPMYNNDSRIASNMAISRIKLAYYSCFAWLYAFVGSFAHLVIVNGTWTENHIRSMWNFRDQKQLLVWNDDAGDRSAHESLKESGMRRLVKIYPPCNTKYLLSTVAPTTKKGGRLRCILSIGQFRPEKDHILQLNAFSIFRRKEKYADVKLVLLGSTRNAEDDLLVSRLKIESAKLGLLTPHQPLGALAGGRGGEGTDSVQFVVNAPFSELQHWLATAAVGIHTMWNEHFGISVVEMMAAGLIVVAHKSGGPLMDIVTPYENQKTGFLADSPEDFAARLDDAFAVFDSDEAASLMRAAASKSVSRFSDEKFSTAMLRELSTILV